MSLPPEKASELKQLIHQQLSKVRGRGCPSRLWPPVSSLGSLVPADYGTCLLGTQAKAVRRRAWEVQSSGFEARGTV